MSDITIGRMLSDDAEISLAPGSGPVVRIELAPALDRALLARYL